MARGVEYIGILERSTREKAQKNAYCYLLIEKILIESKYDWFKCAIIDDELIGYGYLYGKEGEKRYKILLRYSYQGAKRYERIWITEPCITYHPQLHMYSDGSLCLYYPDDLPVTIITPLVTMLPWVSEWIVKYEFWKKYKVWIGIEAPH